MACNSVEACGNDGRWIELQTIDMTGAGNDWQQVKVPLDRFNYLEVVGHRYLSRLFGNQRRAPCQIA